MADSKNTDHGQAKLMAEKFKDTNTVSGHLARCYLEREAMLTKCKDALALFERMAAQGDTPICISFAERDAARALYARLGGGK